MSGRVIVGLIRSSESFTALSYRQRDLWQGLIVVADDQGRLQGTPALVRSAVWPADDISLAEVQSDLDVLASCEDPFIVIYQVEGKTYIQIINWWKYQKMQWASPSAYPAPENWLDRVRVNMAGNREYKLNWEREGGFIKVGTEVATKAPTQEGTAPAYEVKKLKEVKEKDKQKEDKLSQPGQLAQNLAASGSLDGEDPEIAWKLALGELQRVMPRSEFESWVKPSRYIGYNDGVFKIGVVNYFAADRLNQRVSAELCNQLRGFVGRAVSINFVVDGAQVAITPKPVAINTS